MLQIKTERLYGHIKQTSDSWISNIWKSGNSSVLLLEAIDITFIVLIHLPGKMLWRVETETILTVHPQY